MVSIYISILVVFLFVSTTLSKDQDKESQAIETFQNEYGDVYECLDIYKQPSLNHPLLKNHKIQMRPTSKYLNVIRKRLKITCPRGTVPTRRLSSNPNPKPLSNVTLVAGMTTKNITNNSYYGASAIVSVYKPRVKPDQMSGVVISLQSQSSWSSVLNKIEAGWMVNPTLHGDNKTRLYTSWTAAKGTGCYNIECPGFIIINSKISIDSVLNETTIGESKRVQTFFKIFQDKATGNWWFVFGRKNSIIGYWPKELLPDLVNGAKIVEMGGIISSSQESTPPLGSGKDFMEKWSYYNTAFFAQLQFNDKTYLPVHGDNTFIDRKNGADAMKPLTIHIKTIRWMVTILYLAIALYLAAKVVIILLVHIYEI